MPSIYLVSYRPIIHNKEGREAAKKFGFSPYVDGSCRREPDFESLYPSISALCRGGLFAPKLKVGDTVVYITCKGKYPPYNDLHWRIIAILQVAQRFESHEAAAEWYNDNGVPLPSNCIVAGNNPQSFEKTNKRLIPELEALLTPSSTSEQIIRLWDAGYKKRARKYPAFLTCSIEYLELNNPAPITRDQLIEIFDKVPGTQNAKSIKPNELEQLRNLATGVPPITV